MDGYTFKSKPNVKKHMHETNKWIHVIKFYSLKI